MMFENRSSAALKLLENLQEYKNRNVLVAGIPRGAMPMAQIIAHELRGELNAVLVHKISSSYNDEFAIGCIGLSGHIHLTNQYDELNSYIQTMAAKQLHLLKERQKNYGLRAPDYKGRTVIIVDDGIATGATVTCAIHEVRASGPEKIILATPVASVEAAQEVGKLVDEFVCSYVAPDMYAIGQYYKEFGEVTDRQVYDLLHGSESSGYKHHEI